MGLRQTIGAAQSRAQRTTIIAYLRFHSTSPASGVANVQSSIFLLGINNVYRNGQTALIRADHLLVARLGLNELEGQGSIVRRASSACVLDKFRGIVYCLALCHVREREVRLVLGRPERISGTYE